MDGAGGARVTLKASHTPWDDALARIDPARFETLLADYYRSRGWQVEQVGADFTGRRYDDGFDLELRRDDAFVIVQCKRWKAFQVPHNEVLELLGTMVNVAATAAIYVTSGEFTQAAVDVAARSGHVELVDGDALRTMLDPLALESAARDGAPPMYAHPQTTLSVGTPARVEPRRGLLVPALALAACVTVCAGVVHSLNAMVRPAPRLTATRGAQIPPEPDPASSSRAINAMVDPYSLARNGFAAHAAFVQAARAATSAGADSIATGRPSVAPRRGIDREAARAAVRPLSGVRKVFWLDDNDLVVAVDPRRSGAVDMVEQVCRALAPLGDTASIIVELQDPASKRAGGTTLSRTCAASAAARRAVPQEVAASNGRRGER